MVRIMEKIKNMDEFEKAAWRGFLIGVSATAIVLAYPIYLFLKVMILKWGL